MSCWISDWATGAKCEDGQEMTIIISNNVKNPCQINICLKQSSSPSTLAVDNVYNTLMMFDCLQHLPKHLSLALSAANIPKYTTGVIYTMQDKTRFPL